ncbi:MAG: hypothetical protein LBV32_10170 [Tannerellaceae bacterium]|jgi:hypothetical protein|nr:hypothetical protein [Tannerellaceae bacterium]
MKAKKRFTDFFIKRAVGKLAKVSGKRKRCFRSLQDARDIVVFYEAKDSEQVEPGLNALRALQKNVHPCVYSAGQENARGFPIPEIANRINALRADILIDLTGGDCYPMKYLLLQHPSRFKAGIKTDGKDLYDFSISATGREELPYLFEQIIFYLQTIRSK